MQTDWTWIWLIPLLPLFAVVLTPLLAGWLREKVCLVVISAIAGSAVLSLTVLALLAGHSSGDSAPIIVNGYDWINIGSLRSSLSLAVDPLTAVMLATVSVVSLIVAIYSRVYMAGDHGFGRYFAFIGLFVFSMLMLVLADNFLMLYVFWEAVGLCSYLLIGFYYQRPSAAAAAKKAFLVNRIGDFGFAVGILLIFLHFGSVNFAEVFDATGQFAREHPNWTTIIAMCLFAGAVGKSAQLPLYVWLPDAMEGPSPVSALIHAATMVTAGVYMVVRCGAIFTESAVAMTVIAIIGGLTALFAATIAVAQTDIKRILAYSTISQLGYMFLAIGVGAAGAAVFHLYTHAFFKALLFLAAGAIMHAMSDRIDLREMAGLKKYLPWTRWMFLIGALALVGFPGFAGFFSKDQILAAALNHSTLGWLGWIGVATAALTAFYTFRCYFLVFHGPKRLPDGLDHPHKESHLMSYCLLVLAIGAVAAGYVDLAGSGGHAGWFGSFLAGSESICWYKGSPAAGHAQFGHKAVMFICVTVTAAGILAAAVVYLPNRRKAEWLAHSPLRPIRSLLANKYYVDEFYNAMIVSPLRRVGRACFSNDNWVIDSALWLITAIVHLFGVILRTCQRGFLQTYAILMVAGLVLIFFLVLCVL